MRGIISDILYPSPSIQVKRHAILVCQVNTKTPPINSGRNLIFVLLNEDMHAFDFYSGKAAYGMLKDMSKNPTKWEGRKVLFVHTGGLLGLYDKVDQLASLVGSWRRMDLEEFVHAKMALVRCF